MKIVLYVSVLLINSSIFSQTIYAFHTNSELCLDKDSKVIYNEKSNEKFSINLETSTLEHSIPNKSQSYKIIKSAYFEDSTRLN